MDGKSPRIIMTALELNVLAGLMGADTLVGVPDPCAGRLAEEVQAAVATAREQLTRQRLLAEDAGGRVVIDAPLALLVGACAFPQASLLLTHTVASAGGGDYSTRVYTFHITRQLCVELTSHLPPLCELRAYPDAAAVYRRVVALLGLQDQAAPAAAGGIVPEAALVRARAVAAHTVHGEQATPGAQSERGTGVATATLQQAGLDSDTAAALARTLACPVANGSLATLVGRGDGDRGDIWETGGVGFLAGNAGLWRLHPRTRGGDTWVEVRPCTGVELQDELRRVMNQALPVPVQPTTPAACDGAGSDMTGGVDECC